MQSNTIIRIDYYGTGTPTKIAIAGISYYDTVQLTRYIQRTVPYGSKWDLIEQNVLPDFATVKADPSDSDPGPLSAKVDGVTIRVNTTTHQMEAVGADGEVDGGSAASVYLVSQVINGGSA